MSNKNLSQEKYVSSKYCIRTFLFILFLIVGVIGGWVARDYMMNYQEVEKFTQRCMIEMVI